MASAATYSVRFKITINHQYLGYNECCFEIMPSAVTAAFLQREKAIFRKQGKSVWVVLSSTDEKWQTEAPLDFYIKVTDNDFYYYTDIKYTAVGKGWEVTDVAVPGIWKTLLLNVNDVTEDNACIAISVSSLRKYFEVNVISKTVRQGTYLLREETGKLEFIHTEVEIPGELNPVHRFTSKDPVQLIRAQEYAVVLWEKKENSNVLITNAVPLPKVKSASLTSPKDTISSYFYF